ncbi:hypothetical protein EDD18DRAFT_1114485 [Armillaria luteobubalina]|uniref:Uncharacterized protein n=1 Tax=Armillaria luteobubalina TaxID=153913 RepID=A0AA39P5L5_9AGAR|nr:hypothetical protein EDD18DRAFT_1114485 [Armillaria luteobubalina]
MSRRNQKMASEHGYDWRCNGQGLAMYGICVYQYLAGIEILLSPRDVLHWSWPITQVIGGDSSQANIQQEHCRWLSLLFIPMAKRKEPSSSIGPIFHINQEDMYHVYIHQRYPRPAAAWDKGCSHLLRIPSLIFYTSKNTTSLLWGNTGWLAVYAQMILRQLTSSNAPALAKEQNNLKERDNTEYTSILSMDARPEMRPKQQPCEWKEDCVTSHADDHGFIPNHLFLLSPICKRYHGTGATVCEGRIHVEPTRGREFEEFYVTEDGGPPGLVYIQSNNHRLDKLNNDILATSGLGIETTIDQLQKYTLGNDCYSSAGLDFE